MNRPVDENSTLVTTITNSDQNTYTDEGLNSGTVYYYKVYVYSNTNIGSASNEVSATTSRDISSWVSTETISSLSASYTGHITVNSMHIISENDIWLGGQKEIWHYNGSSWSLSMTTGYGEEISAITFASQNKGWAVGGIGGYRFIYEYNGISWSKLTNVPLTYYSQDIVALSEENVWIIGNTNNIVHFDGDSWTTTSLDFGSGVDLDAVSENNIWALGSGGKVFHYNGVGWALVEDLYGSNGFVGISAISDDDVWVTNSNGASSNTSSSSGLWHYNGSQFDGKHKIANDKWYEDSYAIEMISANEGWSCYGDSYGFKYFDGSTWSDVANPVNSKIKCIKFLTRDKGWAVTEDGTILRYVE